MKPPLQIPTLFFNSIPKSAITDAQATAFVHLLQHQGKVRNPSIIRVKACQQIVIAYSGKIAIGIGAIKPKTPADFQPEKADLPGLARNIAFELGYMYVDPAHRGLGISNTIVKLLLREYAHKNLIATTELVANNPMVALLLKNGFHRMGASWKSQLSRTELGLFVRLNSPNPNIKGVLPANIVDFHKTAKQIGFEEYPYIITGQESELRSLADYAHADIDFRIYLTRLVLCRNFSPAGGYEVLTDHLWLLQSFLSTYKEDVLKPWLTNTIREAIESVLSDAVFTRNLLGTTFLFGVIEFYAKHLLGWRPTEADFFDDNAHQTYRQMFIGDAINKLKKQQTPLAKDLNAIDRHSTRRLKELKIEEKRWVKAKIADRLSLIRNTMLHGEEHSFYSMGRYLAALYILFHLYTLKANIDTHGK